MRSVDRTTLVAGLVTTVAGLLLLLDRLDEIDLGLGSIEVVREGSLPDQFRSRDFRFDADIDNPSEGGTGCA